MNRAAVECAIKFGLAVGATIAPQSVFARKNYFYPDLPKGYQISQYELPVVIGGTVPIHLGGIESRVQLTRAHLEEDAGKSLHEGLDTPGVSGIDLNRAGTPLLEIVTEPVMHSATEAVAYAKALHGLVTWLGICDGNMQEGSFRCDANVSVRPRGQKEYGTRCEIKNLNSFRFLERAIQYEVRRQIELIEDGGRVVQETRLYDADRDQTRTMRSKEDAMDYRYFPDPDLLPLMISPAWVEEIRETMPELPAAMCARFEHDWQLSAYDAGLLVANPGTARYFESVLAELGAGGGKADAKLAANWVNGELAAALNRAELDIGSSPLGAAQLAQILQKIADGTLSGKTARVAFEKIWGGEKSLPDIIEKYGLAQVSDSAAIERMVDEVLAANPHLVEEFKAGKEKAFQALVGQAMKASKGKANPQQVNEILKRKLAG
jgi:aspartyl-tRNA(Asn)/glutamyl-tRNA(Gln) amidotransferase subunit B